MDAKIYTEKYEYVREMIQTHIDMEEKLFENKLIDLYDDGSWHVSFFELNLCQATYTNVQKQIDRIMNVGGTEQVQYNTALARMQSLFVNIVMAAGEEFMNELENNLIVSLMHLGDPRHNRKGDVYKTYDMLVKKHPMLVISSIGSPYFQAKHAKFIHSNGRNSQTQNKSGVALR